MSSHQPWNHQRGMAHNARISAAPYGASTLKCWSCFQFGHKARYCKFTPNVVSADRRTGEQAFHNGPQQQTRFNEASGQGYSRGGGGGGIDGGPRFGGRAAPGGNLSNNLSGNGPFYGPSTSYGSNNSGAGGTRSWGQWNAPVMDRPVRPSPSTALSPPAISPEMSANMSNSVCNYMYASMQLFISFVPFMQHSFGQAPAPLPIQQKQPQQMGPNSVPALATRSKPVGPRSYAGPSGVKSHRAQPYPSRSFQQNTKPSAKVQSTKVQSTQVDAEDLVPIDLGYYEPENDPTDNWMVEVEEKPKKKKKNPKRTREEYYKEFTDLDKDVYDLALDFTDSDTACPSPTPAYAIFGNQEALAKRSSKRSN